MSRAIAALALLLALPAAAECDATPLVTNDPTLARSWSVLELLGRASSDVPDEKWLEQDPGTTTLGATPEARWKAATTRALAKVDPLVRGCTPAELDALEPILFARVFVVPTPVEALKQYALEHPPSSALVASVATTQGAFPAPVPLQLGLSQVVTKGQPGFAPSLAGSPAAKSPSAFLRHLSIAGGALIVTPTTQAPELASFDVSAAWSNTPSPDDWLREVNAQQDQDAEGIAGLARAAVVDLFRNYKGTSTAPNEAAFRAALAASTRWFTSRVNDRYVDRHVVPLERANLAWAGAVAMRVRGTPNATFVPELPDLLSAGVEATGRLQFLRGGVGSLAVQGSASAAYSGWSTRRFASWSAIDASAHGARFDLSLGLSSTLTTGVLGAPAPRLTAQFVARGLLGASPDGNLGFNGQLEVPVSANVSLLGSVLVRCNSLGCIQTSGLTLAVSKLD